MRPSSRRPRPKRAVRGISVIVLRSIVSPRRCARDARETPSLRRTPACSGIIIVFSRRDRITIGRHEPPLSVGPRLTPDLSRPRPAGKKAFIAGVADDQGFGWAIAKCLAEAGCEIILGTWVPALNIFETSLRRGKFDESRTLSDGSLMEFAKVYPLDAVFDTYDDVPEDIRTNKRYAGNENWTVAECAKEVEKDFGKIDILVHPSPTAPRCRSPSSRPPATATSRPSPLLPTLRCP